MSSDIVENLFSAMAMRIGIYSRDIVDDVPVAMIVEPPRESAHGEMASNAALLLTKSAGIPPREIAEALRARLVQDEDIAAIDIAGLGFINLTLRPQVWQGHLRVIIALGDGYGCGLSSIAGEVEDNVPSHVANIEYVSANPTGPLHIGHVRGAVFGDALANLLVFTGFWVEREYYVNDAGGQIDVLARSVLHHLRMPDAPLPEGYYGGDYIAEVAREFSVDTDDAEILEQARMKAPKLIMELIVADLVRLGVQHTRISHERALQAEGKVEEAIALLEAKGHVYRGVLPMPKGVDAADWDARKAQATLNFRATDFGDDADRALQKPDGSWTYFANDIAYHWDKYRRLMAREIKTPPRLIDVWGADHGGYVKRVSVALDVLSDASPKSEVKALEVKLCQLVRLLRGGTPVKMSKRAGNYITLAQLLDEVGADAVRFMMLTRKQDAPLDFDYEQVKQQNRDNPVFYVQYAHARICSVLKQGASAGFVADSIENVDLACLTAPQELSLMRLLAEFPRMIASAADALEPHRIAFYLQELAGELHRLWTLGKGDESLRFIQDNDPATTAARLVLLKAVRQVLRNGMAIIGVTMPDEMR